MTSLSFHQIDPSPSSAISQIPGKLFIMGEYAILQPQQAAILMAIDQYLTCHIQSFSNKSVVHLECQMQTDLVGMDSLSISRDQSDQLIFSSQTLDQWRLAIESYRLVDRFFEELGLKFEASLINFQSDLQAKNGAKYGFGSSGALVVSLIKALLDFHGLEFLDSKELVFKLASLASLMAGSNGSMADIATICHGGWIYYQAFDRDWIRQKISDEISLLQLLESTWPGLKIESLPVPDHFQTLIGWTGQPASTQNLVAKLKDQTKDHPQAYQNFLARVSYLVDQAKTAIIKQDWLSFQSALAGNRQALVDLGLAYQLPIETDLLKGLADLASQAGGVGKLSGAGGGDCGLAFAKSQEEISRIGQAWLDQGIQPLSFQTAAVIQ